MATADITKKTATEEVAIIEIGQFAGARTWAAQLSCAQYLT